jgi:hypothetical protein
MIQLEDNDADVFLTIARSSGGTLTDFFAAADHLNSSILDEELEGAVNRLVSCGLVQVQNGSLALTEAGHAMFDRVGGYAGYPRRQADPIRPLLAEIAARAELKSAWRSDPAAMKAAHRAWHKLAAAFMRESRTKKE